LRAGIYDRNNFPLAVSVTQYNLFALRNFSADNYEAINAIAPIKKTFKQIDGLRRKSVLFLNLDFSQYEEIQKLRLDSIEIESVQKRYYPLGEQIAPLIGFAGRDGVGTDGLEKILNTQLSGISGSEIVLKNASRKPQVVTPAIPGVAFKLTIDSRVQFIAFKHLSRFIEANDAIGGSAVVLDNQSGEILAIASYPSYNPNNPGGCCRAWLNY
jgi:cell division protein FtsI (penicillin-binding protein 3)